MSYSFDFKIVASNSFKFGYYSKMLIISLEDSNNFKKYFHCLSKFNQLIINYKENLILNSNDSWRYFMTYIVICNKCKQKSLCEIKDLNNPEERKCSVCGASDKDVEIEISVEEAMPPLDLIAKGMKLK